MTIESIDFSKLKHYDGKTTKCFEQLCYQIAYREFSELGKFTAIDGSGGDGGVEFYLRLANGDVWGWQCKFYQETGRLDSKRKISIKNSLETACRNHKQLKKWFLCLKTDLTDDSTDKNQKKTKGERFWFENTLPQSIPDGREIEIDYWGATNFLTFFTESKHFGIRNFFFGELEFDTAWFERKVQENFAVVNEKYDPDLHSLDRYNQSIIDFNLLSTRYLLSIDKLKEELDYISNRLEKQIEQYRIQYTEAEQQTENVKYQRKYSALLRHIKTLDKIFDNIRKGFRENDAEQLRSIALDDWGEKYRRTLSILEANNDPILHEESNENICKLAEEYFTAYHIFFRNYYHNPSKQINFVAEKGKGKTHCACDIASTNLKEDKPALFITV